MTEFCPYSDKYQADVVRLVQEFHRESLHEYDDIFNPEAVLDIITKQKENNAGNCFLLIVDGICHGMLFGMMTPSMVNGSPMFQEIIWYVSERYRRYGIKLLRYVEKVLKERNCGILIMAVMENSKTAKLKRFYERLGFKKMETHFVITL